MMNGNRTEVEIILKNGKSIVMHCENYTVTTDAFGGITGFKFSRDSDIRIPYINGAEIAAIVEKLGEGRNVIHEQR